MKTFIWVPEMLKLLPRRVLDENHFGQHLNNILTLLLTIYSIWVGVCVCVSANMGDPSAMLPSNEYDNKYGIVANT